MSDSQAVPVFTDRLEFRVVGDTGLLVMIDGREDHVARGVPRAFMLAVDGRRTLGEIIRRVDEELELPRESIRRSVDDLVEELRRKGGLTLR